MTTAKTSADPLDRLALALATAGGAGFVPGLPGTAGSAVGVGIFVALWAAGLDLLYLPLLGLLVAAGIWSAGQVERLRGHDASVIVIDEVVGQMLALALVPRTSGAAVAGWAILGFLLFRFFDILKPFPVRHLERLPGGVGVVADDLGAGAYSLLLLLVAEFARARFL